MALVTHETTKDTADNRPLRRPQDNEQQGGKSRGI